MYYLNPENALNRLRKEWLEHDGLIVAVDFDSTLCPYKDYEVAVDKEEIRDLVRELYENGCTIVIWTAAEKERHFGIKAWLTNHNIQYDYFNDQIPGLKYNSRKIYANAFLDDRAGLWQVFHQLKAVLDEHKLRQLIKINLNESEQSKKQETKLSLSSETN